MTEWVLGMGAVMFLLFSYDKWAAVSKRRRLPESWLLLGSMIGGAWGALLSMALFRHKIKKLLFRSIVPISMLIWAILWARYRS